MCAPVSVGIRKAARGSKRKEGLEVAGSAGECGEGGSWAGAGPGWGGMGEAPAALLARLACLQRFCSGRGPGFP